MAKRRQNWVGNLGLKEQMTQQSLPWVFFFSHIWLRAEGTGELKRRADKNQHTHAHTPTA